MISIPRRNRNVLVGNVWSSIYKTGEIPWWVEWILGATAIRICQQVRLPKCKYTDSRIYLKEEIDVAKDQRTLAIINTMIALFSNSFEKEYFGFIKLTLFNIYLAWCLKYQMSSWD